MFFDQEQLTLENSRLCDGCRRTDIHIRKLTLAEAPEFLIIQLKRFVFNPLTYCYEKANQCIYYPIRDFDISPYTDLSQGSNEASMIYDLVGVVLHAGSMRGGHYTALALNDINKSWYLYDDSKVIPVREDDVQCANAYILFYKKT